ncbi:MAG: protease inhibitor I42 family protein [Chloroflexi bacterium]|nr:protease inhibitor I42 family protein [Chloroflexota bacterium]
MKRIFFITLVLIFLLSACGSAPDLQVSDSQKVIEVNAGKEFNIVLEANPTTGYHWAIVGELDPNVVGFVKNEYTSTSDPNLVGGGGVDIWTFKALSAGETQITLGYYPPSNEPVDPQQTVTFTISVK